jgi:hypothetical protein
LLDAHIANSCAFQWGFSCALQASKIRQCVVSTRLEEARRLKLNAHSLLLGSIAAVLRISVLWLAENKAMMQLTWV